MDTNTVRALDTTREENLELLDVCQRILTVDTELGQETSPTIKQIAIEIAESEAKRIKEANNGRDSQ